MSHPTKRSRAMHQLKAEIFREIDRINDTIVNIRHDLHANPELSGSEEHTKFLVKGILEAAGIPVREFEGNNGLAADIIKAPGLKTVAIRADMDALPITEETGAAYASKSPGIMHACGHDSHTAVALGCALALNSQQEKLPGNIRLIFQPSEETKEGGSIDLIQAGVLEGVGAIFALHAYPYLNTGKIGYKHGVMMASADIFTIEVFGRSSHGARPHEGVDAILVTSMIVNSLNHIVSRRIDPLHPAVISLGTIEGGRAPNVICNHVILTGTVRTVNEQVRNRIPVMMEESIKGICHSMGATYNFDYDFGQPELINDNTMVDLLVREASEIIGAENCIDLLDPVMGGEDFAEYLQAVPGAFIRLGSCNEAKGTCVPQHNSRFDVDDDALKIGMKVLSAAAIGFLDEK